MVKTLSELHDLALIGKRKKLVLAAAHDRHALQAAISASAKGLVDIALVGDIIKVEEMLNSMNHDIRGVEIINEPDNERAAEIAVRMVSEKHADIVMKGCLPTSCLLKAVLNKEWGLRSGDLLSHLSIFELPAYHKLLSLTDAAMNIAPDLNAKVSILNNAVNYLLKLKIETPKVAILSAVETVNPDIESSVHAATITKMADRGQIKNCIVDGPLALDNAININSARIKKINSPVAGDADLILGNDLDSSNALYKSFIYLASARCAAVIVGARAPIVLTSRADSDETKLNSIVLAACTN